MDRPAYADYPTPQKFQSIQAIIMQRLREHPKAVCSYSGGSDSDILIHMIEQARQMLPSLQPVKYVYFNTGLEMQATKDHVRQTAEKYGVEIETIRPKLGIVNAVRKYGQPLISKVVSEGLERLARRHIPVEIAYEYEQAEDKPGKFRELLDRYGSAWAVMFLCSCDKNGDERNNTQLSINSNPFLVDFLKQNPPQFKISKKCCDWCKKAPAHQVNKNFDMVITGERWAEGGVRSVINVKGTGCFSETGDGKYRMRPLYWVSDKDKAWYKETWGIRYSDAYEVYGMKRTGCCGCPIASKAVEELEQIRQYEPNLVKAAWNVFGDSYRYRAAYNKYKAMRYELEKQLPGQMSIDDFLGGDT